MKTRFDGIPRIVDGVTIEEHHRFGDKGYEGDLDQIVLNIKDAKSACGYHFCAIELNGEAVKLFEFLRDSPQMLALLKRLAEVEITDTSSIMAHAVLDIIYDTRALLGVEEPEKNELTSTLLDIYKSAVGLDKKEE